MLPFHKCCRIYEIKGSVICEIRVKGFIKFARRTLGSILLSFQHFQQFGEQKGEVVSFVTGNPVFKGFCLLSFHSDF